MKITRIRIAGIRGFNEERTIDLDDGLTIISAKNSYGKTSITEALEWLLYGSTSKIEKGADYSKEEYKGSLRNAHYRGDAPAFVEAVLAAKGKEFTVRATPSGEESMSREVDGVPVADWPFAAAIADRPKPFVLQHALKHLLLVRPSERFEGFSRLLGLQDLIDLQSAVTALCTKPQVHLPPQAEALQDKSEHLLARVNAQPGLVTAAKHLKRGTAGLRAALDQLDQEARARAQVEPGMDPLPRLLEKRDEAIAKVFHGAVAVRPVRGADAHSHREDLEFLAGFCDDDRCSAYAGLAGLTAAQEVMRLAKFFEVGVGLLRTSPGNCPLCGQPLDETSRAHAHKCHNEARDACGTSEALREKCLRQQEELSALRRRTVSATDTTLQQISDLCSVSSIERAKNLLEASHPELASAAWDAYRSALALRKAAEGARLTALRKVDETAKALDAKEPSPELLKQLAARLLPLVKVLRDLDAFALTRERQLADAHRVLQLELDKLTGTEEVSVIADALKGASIVGRAFAVQDVLARLKGLRIAIDQFVARKLLDAINTSLSAAVAEWYDKIKTTGDPDVHFAGFDLPQTTQGTYRKQIAVKARSYDKDLVSAVSCLSESKLNALGLCVNLAANTTADCPFGFLVVDDPIQSLDEEHEAQFVDVIRSLVEEGKQVILLSHNKPWLDQVRDGCRSLNGRFYCITQYDVRGPHITQEDWCPIRQRLNEARAILGDATASDVKLQHAEQEIRFAVTQIAAQVAQRAPGERRDPGKLKAQDCRSILLGAGISGLDDQLVDKVCQAFGRSDESHHAPKSYSPNRQRTLSLLGSVERLYKKIASALLA